VQQKEIDHILSSVKAPLNHPLFYPRIFALIARRQREVRATQTNTLLNIITEEYDELSRRLDRSQIQESCSVRNVLRTRQLAQLLIDEKGEINLSALPVIISYFKEHLYSLGPQRQHDGKRQEHILKVLQILTTQKEFVRLLKKFTRPLANKWAEELIRHTLQLSPGTIITDAHTRQAVLAAWLCYLRQNVGSCFATAPAEIIHDEQPELFLQDLLDLIATGTLKRTFGGIENSVPLSASWGSGDLKKPLLIRISTKGINPEIWYSPGLIAAFEAIGFLKPEDRFKQKMQQIEGWIKPLIQQNQSYSFCILTVEEIMRKLLLQTLGITEKQVKEYENRPREMIHSQLIIHAPSMKSSGGMGERCANFLQLFEVAKNTFKALADNALLKAWEFTLASFSDIKYEFARWNFYASLGLQTNEPGGIGQCIYQIIQHKLDLANKKAQDIQYEYEMVYTQVKTLEARMRHASTEKEVEWLKIEYQSRLNEFYFLEEQRNEAQNQAAALVNLYDTLYKLYVDLFKDYFQEVYDADMQEVTTGPFDDSPAGFRLLYKHGRSNTSQWTRIQNQHDFIDALASFFVATEPQIAHALDGKKIEKDLSDVVTGIINHVKTKEFLESALHRMAIAHHAPLIKDPLEHLEHVEKKPWVYTSGGTMNTLVSCYYRIEDRPKEVEKWVENEMELLVYLADTLKQIPLPFLNPYLKEQRQSMLMQSPTHAFLLKPTLSPFKETWLNDEFTYTFIRDRFVRPAEIFVEHLLLNDEMLHYLIQQIGEKIPENFQPRFQTIFGAISGPLNPIFFREYLIDMLENDRGLRYGSHSVLAIEEVDCLLYSLLPFFPIHELKDRLQQILVLLPDLTSERIAQMLQLFDQVSLSRGEQSILGAQQLQDICKALLCLSAVSTTTPYDYHLHISLAAQKLGFAMPTPLIFADTNWVKDMFGFVVNPGTGKLEIWRLDYTGSTGYPMTSWKQWIDGSRSDLRWGIYVKPFQYGQA
jgi:hypothetical protein